jgi:hypothetical protein
MHLKKKVLSFSSDSPIDQRADMARQANNDLNYRRSGHVDKSSQRGMLPSQQTARPQQN